MQTQGHVIVCGFGRSGQGLIHLLEQEDIGYVALDLDPDRVREAQLAGESVVYGDATRRESLTAAGIQRAAALVVTYAETAAAEKTLHFAHELAPELPVIVRTHDDSDLDRLRRAGATEVVPEIIEGSLMLASHALMLLGVPMARVAERLAQARSSRYRMLSGFFHGADDKHDGPADANHVRLRSVTVGPKSRVVGRSLAEIDVEKLGVSVTAIRRRGIRGVDPSPDARLMAGDGVVLRGSAEALALAEQRLA